MSLKGIVHPKGGTIALLLQTPAFAAEKTMHYLGLICHITKYLRLFPPWIIPTALVKSRSLIVPPVKSEVSFFAFLHFIHLINSD